MKEIERIAVLGAGAMGARMAINLMKAGHQVVVYNRNPERVEPLIGQGAVFARTPKEAAEGASIVISMVRDNEASRAVWFAEDTGAIHGLSPSSVALESSTLTPDWIREWAKRITSLGADYLEAPVLGSRPQAEAGKLIYLIGGRSEVLERLRPILELMAGAIHHVGEAGTASSLKLAVNTQYSAQVAILAETLTLLSRQGIQAEAANEILKTLPTTSMAMQVAGQLMAMGNYTPMFPIELVEKDLRYTLQLAEASDMSTPSIRSVHGIYREAAEAGLGDENIVAVVRLYEISSD